MSPHFWVQFRSAKKIAAFTLAVVAVVVFWSVLPAEARQGALSRYHGRPASLGPLMFAGWVGGWFLHLFVRGEDLHLTAPHNFRLLLRVVAAAMIGMSLVIAGFFAVRYLL